jgi:hypothetical protein
VATELGVRIITPANNGGHQVLSAVDDPTAQQGFLLVVLESPNVLAIWAPGRIGLWDVRQPTAPIALGDWPIDDERAPLGVSLDGRWWGIGEGTEWTVYDIGGGLALVEDPVPAACLAIKRTELPARWQELIAPFTPRDPCAS